VTVESSAKFHGAVYLDKPHRVEARVGTITDDRMEATARIVDRKERVRAEAAGTFAVLGEAQATRVIGDNLGSSADAYLKPQ
jgi:acyl-CoA thioesterase FadM